MANGDFPTAIEWAIGELTVIAQAIDRGELDGSMEALGGFLTALEGLTTKAETSLRLRRLSTDDSPPHVSETRRARRAQQLAQRMVESAPVGIFRLDAEGRIVDANPCACRSLGYRLEELLKLTVYDIDPNFTRERWLAHRQETRKIGNRTLQTTHQRKDGSVFPIELVVRQLTFEGVTYSVSYAEDTSERLAAEQERRSLEARVQASQRLESLGILAGGIAHDFNNLLMVILGNLDLVQRSIPTQSDAHQMLEDVNQAARQAATLCHQLLLYAGKSRSTFEPVSVANLIREQAQMLAVSASRSAELVLHLDDDLPEILADGSQLRQALMNLVLNASDAIGEHAGKISVSARSLDYTEDAFEPTHQSAPLPSGRYVSIEVADSGCGMAESVQNRVFDPFFSTKPTGRGLGLSAVRGIVHHHGGAILLHSKVGAGTTFQLLFPVAQPFESFPPLADANPQPGCEHGLVLLVDDVEPLRSLGERMLARLGFGVLAAKDGREALELYSNARDRITHVILDWTMPTMGGRETLRQLKDLSPSLPIIVATGHAPADIVSRLDEATVAAVICKPYRLEELKRALLGAG